MDKTIRSLFEGIDEIVKVLEDGNLKGLTLMNGEIRKVKRVLNSKKEDVVVNCLTLSPEQIQDGIFNVNVHVPNLTNQPSGIPNAVDNTQPNYARMKEIGTKALEILDDSWLYNSFFYLDSAGEIVPDGNESFFNIRLRYHALRNDKQN